MDTSTTPAVLLAQMAPAAKAKFGSESAWAAACGLPKETLSRLKRNPSCDLRTLAALANVAGCSIQAVSAPAEKHEGHLPKSMERDYEDALVELCASGDVDVAVWRSAGPPFFVAGLAVLLAGERGFDREKYLRLAEALHPGVSVPEVYAGWLARTPVRAARFLPMVRQRMRTA